MFSAKWTGKPNSGNSTISTPYSSVGKGYNLIGNFYQSLIDATSFLRCSPDNGLTRPNAGTIYLWAHSIQWSTSNNYASYNLSGGVKANAINYINPAVVIAATPNGTIQVGQGFILKKSVNSMSIFNNAIQTGNNAGQFFKTATTEKHRIWLNLATERTPLSQMIVGYIEGTTLGYDDSYGGKLINAWSTISSIIDNENYVIQARLILFENTDEAALNFKADAAGSYML